MTVVYIDLLFGLNFVANYLLLLGAGRLGGGVLCRWRIALGAALGAAYATVAFLPGWDWLAQWPCKVGLAVCMVLCAYGGERRLLRITLLFFALSAGLAGAVLGAELLGNASLTLQAGVLYTQMDLRLMLLLFVACYFVLSLFFRRMGQHHPRELVEVELSFPQRQVCLTALRDTGHTLSDPATNRPVMVVTGEDYLWLLPPNADLTAPIETARLCHEQGVKGIRLIPYRAVGVELGVLLAIPVSQVKINGKKAGAMLVALSPTAVDDGGVYQGLIGGM